LGRSTASQKAAAEAAAEATVQDGLGVHYYLILTTSQRDAKFMPVELHYEHAVDAERLFW